MNYSKFGETQTSAAVSEEEIRKKRERSDRRMQTLQSHVFVCNGGCCGKMGSEEVLQEFRDKVAERDVSDLIRITETKCTGRCGDACSVIVYPEGTWYRNVTPVTVRTIVEEHLLKGKLYKEHVSYSYEQGRFVRSTFNQSDSEKDAKS